MTKKISKLLVVFVMIVMGTFGLCACNDPYADMAMNISGAEFGNVQGTKHITLDLSSASSTKVVLSAEISNLKSGMDTGIIWETTDASRVAIRDWVDNGVSYVELTALEITNPNSFVTISATSVENDKIMDEVKVTVVKPVASMEVKSGVLGIPMNDDNYVLKAENFVTFYPAGATMPECIFEIAGYTQKYKSGDKFFIDNAPVGNTLAVKCYPVDSVDAEGNLLPDALVAEFEAMVYTPITEQSIVVENVLAGVLGLEPGEDVRSVELVINGQSYDEGMGVVINPNQHKYSVRDKFGTVIDMAIETSAGVKGNILDIVVNNVDNTFTLMGLERTKADQTVSVVVVTKVHGIDNAPEIRKEIAVSVVEYPQAIVVSENGVNVEGEIRLNYSDKYRIDKKVLSVALSPVAEDIDDIRIELDLSKCSFDEDELEKIRVDNADALSDDQLRMQRILQTFVLEYGYNQNEAIWQVNEQDGTPYVILNTTPESIVLSNTGLILGKVGLKLVLVQAESNPNMKPITRNLILSLEQGIEEILPSDETAEMLHDGTLMLQLGDADMGRATIALNVRPNAAKKDGINSRANVYQDNLLSDGLAVECTDDAVFEIVAQKVGIYQVQFVADTGVRYLLTV